MWLYRHILWRCFPFRNFHNIPDLNGIWEGELQSVLKDGPRSIHVEIRQCWDDILIRTKTDSGKAAVSFTASISVNESVTALSYAFENIRPKGSYLGFNYLRLQDLELMGEYFTNKNICIKDMSGIAQPEKVGELIANGMGSKGFIRVKRKTQRFVFWKK